MTQANVYEQYNLELINAERAKAGVQPLAFNGDLNEAAENHSVWMDTTDTLSHTGAGGSSPYDRMKDAGYVFSSSWYADGENIAALSTRAPAGFVDEVELIHSFFMGSTVHRENILNGTFREIGIGFTVGQYKGYESVFITEDFAMTASNPFLTGVAFDDLDGDKRYDINEGLGSFTVSAKNNVTGAIMTTQTTPAGGYDIELAAGSYTVSFINSSFTTTSQQISIGSKNVKLDLIDPTPSSSKTNLTFNNISGTSSSDALIGTSGDDTIFGLDGDDRLYGKLGNDKIDGGNGRDTLWGNAGTDTLTGGAGKDVFLFNAPFVNAVDKITDFSPVDDTISLDDYYFTSLTAGSSLSATAFYIGTAAHDSTDCIIYNSQTGALYYDADGTGSASAQQFSQLTTGLAMTYMDFYVY